MKVYLVYWHSPEYDAEFVAGVFSTKYKARKFVKGHVDEGCDESEFTIECKGVLK